VNKKCTAKPTEGESIPQDKKKMFHEHRPAEAWFLSYGLLTIKEILEVATLNFSA
jgi:hypothetical protein